MATTSDSTKGAIRVRKSGKRSVVELLVPEGTRRSDILRVHKELVNQALKQVDLGACPNCISGREFSIREEAVLPATFSVARKVLEVNLKTGKIVTRG